MGASGFENFQEQPNLDQISLGAKRYEISDASVLRRRGGQSALLSIRQNSIRLIGSICYAGGSPRSKPLQSHLSFREDWTTGVKIV